MYPNDRVLKSAAAKKMRNKPPYHGPVWRCVIGIEIKAPDRAEATRRIERLLAELVTGSPITASDVWVREVSTMGEPEPVERG